EAKQELRRNTRRAKREYWQNKIKDATQSKDIFQIANWHKSKGKYHTPPLSDPVTGTLATSPADKQSLLARVLLQSTPAAEPSPAHATDNAPPTAIILLPPISAKE